MSISPCGEQQYVSIQGHVYLTLWRATIFVNTRPTCLSHPVESNNTCQYKAMSKAKSVKRFERSNGLDTALYKNYFFLSPPAESNNMCQYKPMSISPCGEQQYVSIQGNVYLTLQRVAICVKMSHNFYLPLRRATIRVNTRPTCLSHPAESNNTCQDKANMSISPCREQQYVSIQGQHVYLTLRRATIRVNTRPTCLSPPVESNNMCQYSPQH